MAGQDLVKSKIEMDMPIEAMHELAMREGNRKKPIYEIHKWWARRLGSNFRMLIKAAILSPEKSNSDLVKEFYKKENLNRLTVLDPFMGGGTSIVEAAKCGARVIGVDIDPVACFITKKELEKCNLQELNKEYLKLEKNVGQKIKKYYKSNTGEGKSADVINYFWVDKFDCPKCRSTVKLHPNYKLFENNHAKRKTVFCRSCNKIHEISSRVSSFACSQCDTRTDIENGVVKNGLYKCRKCNHQGKVLDQIKGKPLEKEMFALELFSPDTKVRQFKQAEPFDRELYLKAERKFNSIEGQLPFPRDVIPTKNREDNRPINYGYKHYYDLFNKRQLLSLSLIFSEIQKIKRKKIKENLAIAFSDSLASNNNFCSYAFAYRKLTPLFGLHAYRIIHRPVEGNVWGTEYGRGSFSKCFKKLIRGKLYAQNPHEFQYEGGKTKKVFTGEKIDPKVTKNPDQWHIKKSNALLLNRSSVNLKPIKTNSVDLILTDPPYYDNLSYSELSDFYFVWLRDIIGVKRKTTPYNEALFVSSNKKNTKEKFIEGLSSVFSECNRILKDNGLMVFTFHHNKKTAWDALLSSLSKNNFIVTNVFPNRSEGRGAFHSSKNSIKWDAVFCCRKKTVGRNNQFEKNNFEYWERRINKANLFFSEADRNSFYNATLVASLANQSS